MLLFGIEEKSNLQQVDVTFYALINYFRKLLEFFWVQHSDKLNHLLVGVHEYLSVFSPNAEKCGPE